MDESEWLAGAHPAPLLDFLRGKVSDRKLRLFACACQRRIWPLLWEEQLRSAVVCIERLADGEAGPRDRKVARRQAQVVQQPLMTVVKNRAASAIFYLGHRDAHRAAREAARLAAEAAAASSTEWLTPRCWAAVATEELAQVQMLRCIFGPLPFRSLSLPSAWPTWNNGILPRLAQAAYEHRQLPAGHLEPARLAILADALEEARCDDAAILDHLRSPGPHVRGCHVLDGLLAREELG